MASKHIRTDVNYAWPTAEIAVMGPEGAVDIVYKRELESAANREEVRQAKIEEFRDRFANPYVAADRGFVDAVIQPRETRKKLIQALEMLQTKRDKNPPKKHEQSMWESEPYRPGAASLQQRRKLRDASCEPREHGYSGAPAWRSHSGDRFALHPVTQPTRNLRMLISLNSLNPACSSLTNSCLPPRRSLPRSRGE